MSDRNINDWFELSYSSYIVLPRVLLESMPISWQRKFVALLDEIKETFDTDDMPGTYTVLARKGSKFVKDPYRYYRHPIVQLKPREKG